MMGGGMPMDPAMMGGGMPMDPAMMGPPEINPQFMDAAATLNDQGVFDAAAAASVLQSPELIEIVSLYLPGLQKALDHLGRILLAISVKKQPLPQQLGEEEYSTLRKRIRRVFNTLGDIIIKLDKQANAEHGDEEELPY